jgi:hypothetical protein
MMLTTNSHVAVRLHQHLKRWGSSTIIPDVPICAVFTFVYLGGVIGNMGIYQLNRRKGHKFFMSLAMFGFCISRVVTCVLRLAWATRPKNVRVAIAAQIFTNVGILVVYIIVLLLILRVFRPTHPKLDWNRILGKMLIITYVLLLIAILATIAFTILSFYTLNPKLRFIALWIQRGAIIYMILFNIMALVLLLLSSLVPQAPETRISAWEAWAQS